MVGTLSKQKHKDYQKEFKEEFMQRAIELSRRASIISTQTFIIMRSVLTIIPYLNFRPMKMPLPANW